MKIKLTHPLISCICITANRASMLLKSIINFENQDYPNKELVVSFPSNDIDTRNLLNEILRFTDQNIILIERDSMSSLGNAKNEALKKCNGEYICLWDDDDYYHSMRVKYQYNNMQINGRYKEASVLTKIILFNRTTNKACLSFSHHWPSTLLCQKDLAMLICFSDENLEDVKPLIDYLENNHYLHLIDDFPLLYSYVYHGGNITNEDGFKSLLSQSSILENQYSAWVSVHVNQQFELIRK
jgi:glycosyltransferase involved in cell wall biosynthesis